MSCDGCKKARAKLYEINKSSWTGYLQTRDPATLTAQVSLCGDCLVGQSIPVFRPSIGRWNIGEVDVFDRAAWAHRLVFDDENDIEWVTVSEKPFKDYISHHLAESEQDTHNDSNLWELPQIDGQSLCSSNSMIDRGSGDYLVFRDGAFSFEYTKDEDESPEDVSTFPALQDIFVPKNQPTDEDHGDSLLRFLEADMRADGKVFREHSFNTLEEKRHHKEPPQSNTLPNNENSENNDLHDNANKKAGPRLWSPEEDRLLCEAVEASSDKHALKWPEIALGIPGRTGKQCRERYLNHLKPNIKHNTDWTPAEDALLFRLHASMGSKWALISKVLKGRSDNSIKNRYHHVRRKLDKQVAVASTIFKQENLQDNTSAANNDTMADSQQKISIAVNSVLELEATKLTLSDWQYEADDGLFGPFVPPREASSCKRCCLIVPSAQTGCSICKKTGWCQSCVAVPPYVSGDLLLKVHGRTQSATQNGPAKMKQEMTSY